MTSTLLQFGAVILVVMIGFAMALHVLFSDIDTFGQTMLGLFNAMLGDTNFFEEFNGSRYDRVATILVVVYLFIVTIMLLNLLVAILSTSHAQVQDNVGTEFKVSKARIVAYYRMVVSEDLLPAPFNLLQLGLSLLVFIVTCPYYYAVKAWEEHCARQSRPLRLSPGVAGAHSVEVSHPHRLPLEVADVPPAEAHPLEFWRAVCADAMREIETVRGAFGRMVFWLVLGLVAVAGGGILWGMSGFFYAHFVLDGKYSTAVAAKVEVAATAIGRSTPRRLIQDLLILRACILGWAVTMIASALILLWCVVGAPCCLCFLWLIPLSRALISFYKLLSCGAHPGEDSGSPGSSIRRESKPTIASMLRKAPGGVGAEKLREFLEDPMYDDDVRQDEKNRPTTVEHVKQLRDYLRTTSAKKFEELQAKVEELTRLVSTVVDEQKKSGGSLR